MLFITTFKVSFEFKSSSFLVLNVPVLASLKAWFNPKNTHPNKEITHKASKVKIVYLPKKFKLGLSIFKLKKNKNNKGIPADNKIKSPNAIRLIPSNGMLGIENSFITNAELKISIPQKINSDPSESNEVINNTIPIILVITLSVFLAKFSTAFTAFPELLVIFFFKSELLNSVIPLATLSYPSLTFFFIFLIYLIIPFFSIIYIIYAIKNPQIL